MSLLPPQSATTPTERAVLHELERCAKDMLAAVDKAVALRTAPSEVKRQRALMKTHLETALSCGLHAVQWDAHHKEENDG